MVALGIGIALVSGSACPAATKPASLIAGLAKGAEAIAAFSLVSVEQRDPAEKPLRLQEFIIAGKVTSCMKGKLIPGQIVRYGLFAEGRPRVPAQTIVFLRHARGHGSVWTAVDGPIVYDRPDVRKQLKSIIKGYGA